MKEIDNLIYQTKKTQRLKEYQKSYHEAKKLV